MRATVECALTLPVADSLTVRPERPVPMLARMAPSANQVSVVQIDGMAKKSLQLVVVFQSMAGQTPDPAETVIYL